MSKPHWNGWGVDPTQHRFQPADMARLDPSDVTRLKLKWAFGFPGASRAVAQPTVFGGRVFVGSQNGKVYSLDAKNGCTYWRFEAGRPVRSAVVIGPRGDGWAAYFGDAGANVYAVDALSGKILWTTKVDQHPAAVITGSPILVGATLFIGSRHSRKSRAPSRLTLAARSEAASSHWMRQPARFPGRRSPLRTKPNPAEPISTAFSSWGPQGQRYGPRRLMMRRQTGSTPRLATITPIRPAELRTQSSPSTPAPEIERGRDRSPPATRTLWHALRGSIAPNPTDPILILARPPCSRVSPAASAFCSPGKSRASSVRSTRTVAAKLSGKREWGSAGRWAACNGASPLMKATSMSRCRTRKSSACRLELPARNPSPSIQALRCSSTARPAAAHRPQAGYGRGGLAHPHPGCGDVPGCSPAQSAAVTAIPGLVFSGGLDGHLRAYLAGDGKIVWDQDTKGDYQTVNGVSAKGGSIDGGGAVVVDGMVYLDSAIRLCWKHSRQRPARLFGRRAMMLQRVAAILSRAVAAVRKHRGYKWCAGGGSATRFGWKKGSGCRQGRAR